MGRPEAVRSVSAVWLNGPMMMRGTFLAVCAAAAALAQQTALEERQSLAELKAVRASLERLEQGQRALLALARIEIEENRLFSLETRRRELMRDEQEYKKEAASAGESLRRMEGGSGGTAVQTATEGEAVASVDLTPFRNRLSQAQRGASDAQRERLEVEKSIAVVRARIAAAEKALEAVGR